MFSQNKKLKGKLRSGRDLLPALRQRVARRKSAAKKPPSVLPGRIFNSAVQTLAWSAAALSLGFMLVAGFALIADCGVFQIKQVQVRGTVHLSRMEILSALGLSSQTNVLRLNSHELAAKLKDLPWLEYAEVSRSLPDQIVVQVKERQPFIVALVEEQMYYLDRNLALLAPLRPDIKLNLPLLTGLSRAELLSPDAEMEELLHKTRLLLQAPPDLWARWGGLAEIHLDRVWGLNVVLEDLPPVLRLGLSDCPWDRLQDTLEDLQQRGELNRALIVDSSLSRRIVVRLGRKA